MTFGRSFPCPDYHRSMNGLSVKLPADLHAMLSREARRRNVSQSFLVRDLIANALSDRGGAPPPSCANLAGDSIGAVHSGRSDLASSRRSCRAGFAPCCR